MAHTSISQTIAGRRQGRNSSRNLKQTPERNVASPSSCSASFSIQPRTTSLGNGAAHSEPGPPTSINPQGNPLQIDLQASLISANP